MHGVDSLTLLLCGPITKRLPNLTHGICGSQHSTIHATLLKFDVHLEAMQYRDAGAVLLAPRRIVLSIMDSGCLSPWSKSIAPNHGFGKRSRIWLSHDVTVTSPSTVTLLFHTSVLPGHDKRLYPWVKNSHPSSPPFQLGFLSQSRIGNFSTLCPLQSHG